ncbi:MAG TPA: hypothetical protein VMV92_25165 [Streptosporangiaceae bacterium]|nr:hypothetical protein [Streptosporangiaceae bacterium]
MPTFTVEFLRGRKAKADGVNYTGNTDPYLSPGQSGLFEADIDSSMWAGHPGDSCEVTREDVFQAGQFTEVASYYP